MADIQTIADYIYRRANHYGVDPHMALGIASREGLNERTLSNPTFGNPDSRGYSFGPFQLWSASRDPRTIAPGGMAYEFQQRYNAPPSLDNWQQQVDFSLERMRNGVTPWHAVRNAGGVEPITQIGREFATRIGLGGPQEEIPLPPPPAPPVPGAETAPAPPDAALAAVAGAGGPSVYGPSLGTALRRLGNWIAPDLVDPATPLTPEQAQAQRLQEREQAERMRNVNSAQRGFLGMQALAGPQQMEQPQLRAQVVGPRQFEPIGTRRRRGLLD